jgi:hypothetical protein
MISDPGIFLNVYMYVYTDRHYLNHTWQAWSSFSTPMPFPWDKHFLEVDGANPYPDSSEEGEKELQFPFLGLYKEA